MGGFKGLQILGPQEEPRLPARAHCLAGTMLCKVLNPDAFEGTKPYLAQPMNTPGVSPIFTMCLAPEDIWT